MEKFWGLDKTIISRVCNCMIVYVYNKLHHLVDYLNIDRLKASLPDFCKAIGKKMELEDPSGCYCFGFIDGTFRRIARPRRYQMVSFSGHYRTYARLTVSRRGLS